MEECIRDLRTWLIDGKLLLNDDETESLVIGTRQQFSKLGPLSLLVGDHNIDPSSNARYLGAVTDVQFTKYEQICKACFYHILNKIFCQRNAFRH